MTGVYKIEIVESEEDLKKLLGQQKIASGKERVQLLYLLKSQQAKTVQEAARILGRHRVTVQEWLKRYREGGLKGLLAERVSTGRPRAIPGWAEKALDKRLQESEGFNSYGEICQWLEKQLGIVANYQTVHQLVYYRLKGSPKVARPQSIKQSAEKLEAFKKNFAADLALLTWVVITVMGLGEKVRFFCQDETRVGLKTISGRKITGRGVKPVGKVQWQFQATYLTRVVEPSTGEHFFFEFSHLNSDCFGVFLELVSQQFPDCVLIIQLDNGGFHKAKKLKIPDNIILLFQPSHCPELNPIERVWQHLKMGLRWELPTNLDELRSLVRVRLAQMTQEVIASLVGRSYILEALSVANI